MKHLILIAITAALVSFTAVQQFSPTEKTSGKSAAGTGQGSVLYTVAQARMNEQTPLLKDTITVVPNGFSQTGVASYYARKFHGRHTSSGEIYHKDSLTCAHKTLKFGTMIRVTNLSNDSTIVVKVTDRMGKTSHILDLSEAGAKQLGYFRNGIAKVKIEEIKTELVSAR